MKIFRKFSKLYNLGLTLSAIGAIMFLTSQASQEVSAFVIALGAYLYVTDTDPIRWIIKKWRQN